MVAFLTKPMKTICSNNDSLVYSTTNVCLIYLDVIVDRREKDDCVSTSHVRNDLSCGFLDRNDVKKTCYNEGGKKLNTVTHNDVNKDCCNEGGKKLSNSQRC
jgi:hypothetical protein